MKLLNLNSLESVSVWAGLFPMEVEIRDGHAMPSSSNAFPKQNETLDPVVLPKWISDVTVKYLLTKHSLVDGRGWFVDVSLTAPTTL